MRVADRRRLAVLRGALACLALALAAAAAPAAGVDRTAVGTFNQPVFAGAPDGDARRLFVVQKSGAIRLLVDGVERDTPFLRIPGRVHVAGERGLLSMAFHPGYERNRRFYVFYNRPSDGDVVVSEFLRSANSPNRANPTSERRLIRVEHSAHSNHNGGQLQFGADRNLYISIGDGGGQPDPDDLAQNKFRRLGKLLRIDPLPSNGDPYSSPSSNPFVGRPGADEIFAYGFRNPFRFSFDSATGDIAIGDVGWQTVEEIDFLRAREATGAPRPGVNFGWDCWEGSERTLEGEEPGCLRGPSPHTPPVLEHRHGEGFRSIIGGYVAHSPSLASQEGRYVYGDFDDGDPLRSAILQPGGAVDDRSIGVSVPQLVSFGEGGTGELYAVSISGTVYQLHD
jgi:glucose/arabinose dehydrogenase